MRAERSTAIWILGLDCLIVNDPCYLTEVQNSEFHPSFPHAETFA